MDGERNQNLGAKLGRVQRRRSEPHSTDPTGRRRRGAVAKTRRRSGKSSPSSERGMGSWTPQSDLGSGGARSEVGAAGASSCEAQPEPCRPGRRLGRWEGRESGWWVGAGERRGGACAGGRKWMD
jgi:hypothetical protein